MITHGSKLLYACAIVGAILMLALTMGCSSSEDPTAPTPTYSQFGAISTAANAYLSSGAAPTITAATVYTNLNDGNAANDPFILSIRSVADYDAGHVPGAVNIGYRDIAKAASLGQLPTNRQIVVVCYTGHTAAQATMLLGMLGYDAVCMKFGMTAWTIDTLDNPSVNTTRPYDSSLDCGDYPVSAAAVLPGAYTPPDTISTTSTDTTEIIRAAADAYLSSGAAPVVTAASVYTNLNDGNAADDPFILSVRGSVDYTAGHIEGAVNIPWREVATAANLAKLPNDKQIVVACYTGHTASMVTLFLSSLGYDAVCMKFGMTAWTIDPLDNPSITTIRYYDPALDCGDYTVDKT